MENQRYKKRPVTMEKIDKLKGINSLAIKEAKEKGEKVVGMYCMFSPQEIALAAGAKAVSLCGTSNDPVAEGETVLPRNLCPLIKSSLGFVLTDTCPYFHFADMVIGETTCDGKKKMFEEMAAYKPLHIMKLPQSSAEESDLKIWVDEMEKLIDFVEEELDVEITEDSLKEAIQLMNRERDVFRRLHQLNKTVPAPLSGLDMMLAQWFKGFNVDKEYGISLVEELIQELEERVARGEYFGTESSPRILFTGTPIGLGSEKVIRILEDTGADVVVLENCTGYKPLDLDIDTEKDPVVAIAEKHLNLPCSCMTPNTDRLDLIGRLAEEYSVDGVVDLTWQACHTYNIESYSLKNYVNQTLGLPFLQVETDYSDSDLGQLQVRVEAFLETLEATKC